MAHSEVVILSAVTCAKTAEPTEMTFGMRTQVGPSKHVLDRSAHSCHLVNTTGLSMCGGNVAISSNYFDHLLLSLLLLLT